MDIATIASVIAAVVGTVTLVFTIRNSKGNITKRSERKEQQIQELENQFYRNYGLHAKISQHYPTSHKIGKLKENIEELRKRI